MLTFLQQPEDQLTFLQSTEFLDALMEEPSVGPQVAGMVDYIPEKDLYPSEDSWDMPDPRHKAPSFASDEYSEEESRGKLMEKFKSRKWRMSHLYYIIGEDQQTQKPKRMMFRPNWAQQYLLDNMWYFNIILKARQLGLTTFICLLFLDTALFRSDTHCGIIAHNRDDAEEFFNNKIRYAYEQLPSWLQEVRKAPSDSKKKLAFSNNSSIRVGTSLRSGTLYMLHISEFGKVCARYPEKAREIVTGGINTVHSGSFIFIESTAEGRVGYFHDFCDEAKKRQLSGIKPNKMEFRFFFFPWWRDPRYVLNPDNIIITAEDHKYFNELESKGIVLSNQQKAWYVTKKAMMRDDMLREFPSTPNEAFQASVIGSYYAPEMSALRKMRRLGRVPYDPLYPVNTFWDIGFNDKMAIWFHQRVGTENRLIDYMEGSGEGVGYYIKRMMKEKDYMYGTHYMPHDGKNGSAQTGKTFEQYARLKGLRNIKIIPRAKNSEEVLKGIEAVRTFLLTCWIDAEKCDLGIKCLDNYRKQWDGNLNEFKRTPLHDWSSNGSDSLRCGAVGYITVVQVEAEQLVPEYAEDI